MMSLIKLLRSLFNRDTVEKEQIHKVSTPVVDETDLNTPLVWPEISAKNKWLYRTNEFDKMERGVVDCQTKEVDEKKKKVMFYLPKIKTE